jgi:hypothetical protein
MAKGIEEHLLKGEGYIKKLNEIIEFFKTEREGQMYIQNFGLSEGKTSVNVILSVVVILIGISNALLIADTKFQSSALTLIFISLFAIGFFMLIFASSSDKKIKTIVDEVSKYNLIINSIQSLKTLTYEVDLLPLIDKIKYRYHLKNTVFFDEKYISKMWFEEVRYCIVEINKEILEKEKVLDKEKLISK